MPIKYRIVSINAAVAEICTYLNCPPFKTFTGLLIGLLEEAGESEITMGSVGEEPSILKRTVELFRRMSH